MSDGHTEAWKHTNLGTTRALTSQRPDVLDALVQADRVCRLVVETLHDSQYSPYERLVAAARASIEATEKLRWPTPPSLPNLCRVSSR